jgi:hypothetical protein
MAEGRDEELTARSSASSPALRAQEEFTPRPWEISGYSDINGHYLHIGAPSSFTVLASMNDTHPATIANARLIAAAPELYEALKAVNGIIAEAALEGFRHDVGDWADRLYNSQQATSRALRKATLHSPTPEAPESKEGE